MCPLCLTQISWQLVLAGAAIYFFVGMFWYAPIFFGTRWMQLTHRKATDAIVPGIIGEAISGILLSYGIAWFMERLNVFNYYDALLTVVMGTLIFAGPFILSLILWERRPIQLVLINMGAFLVSACAIAKLFVYMVG